MKITARKLGDVVVIEMEGVYSRDARPSPSLAEIIDGKLESGEKEYVLDLRNAELASDIAIGDVLAAFSRVHKSGGKIKLSCPTPGTLSLLKMTMLDKVLDIHVSFESALEDFSKH